MTTRLEMNYSFIKNAHYNLFFMYSKTKIDQWVSEMRLAFITSIAKYFISLARSVFLFPLSLRSLSPNNRGKAVFFAISKNNLDALKPVFALFQPDAIMLTNNHELRSSSILIPFIFPYILSIFYIPKSILIYNRASQIDKKVFQLYFHHILLSMGYFRYCQLYLHLFSPKTIVFANDHVYYTRILIMLAEKKGIKCYYLQHSSITSDFPKLFSSFALLEGQYAKEKYVSNGSDSSRITFIGIPKFDKFVNDINQKKCVKRIGICTTRSMDVNEITDLIALIKDSFPDLEVVLRPHPSSESLKKYQDLIDSFDLGISNSKTEDTFAFLNKVDAIISGNSSIHLEAALLNVFPIYYFGQKTEILYQGDGYDKFDYVKNKIAYPVDGLKDVVHLLEQIMENKPNIRPRAKYYCDTVDTVYDGKSAELAVANICETLR